MGGEIGLFVVRVPSFVLAASIVVVGSMLGFIVVGVANVASTSPASTIQGCHADDNEWTDRQMIGRWL